MGGYSIMSTQSREQNVTFTKLSNLSEKNSHLRIYSTSLLSRCLSNLSCFLDPDTEEHQN